MQIGYRVLVASFVVLGAAGASSAVDIKCGETTVNTVQIKLMQVAGKKTWEIQMGGGSNQPPADTFLVGRASAVVDGKSLEGFFKYSTEPNKQMRMTSKAVGKQDVYEFVPGFDILDFQFAATATFADPWVTATIKNATAKQQMPAQDVANANQQGNNQNGNDQGDRHPPIVIEGLVTVTGGSLAARFGEGASNLTLNVGGNQRLYDLQPDNVNSGMKLQTGLIELPEYLREPTPLKELLRKTPTIFLGTVVTLDKGKVVVDLDRPLKGAAPIKQLHVALDRGNDRSTEYGRPLSLFNRLELKQPVVIFAEPKLGATPAVLLYVNGTWARLDGNLANDVLQTRFATLEPFLQRTFKGSTAELRQVIEETLAGKREPPTLNPNERGGVGAEIPLRKVVGE